VSVQHCIPSDELVFFVTQACDELETLSAAIT
jgi:hypothetical protein